MKFTGYAKGANELAHLELLSSSSFLSFWYWVALSPLSEKVTNQQHKLVLPWSFWQRTKNVYYILF